MFDLDFNTTVTFALNQISTKRFAHVLFSYSLPIRIIYKSFSLPILNRERLFRLKLYQISGEYFHHDDFHYISFRINQTVSKSFSSYSPKNFCSFRIINGPSMVKTKIRLFSQDYILPTAISLFKQQQISI